ncbi:FMRFamide receptor-like [Tubulanus polymorphus]|uniref:FMRFamide receptor-like n=1 Tax=Tubulanus polymorphus TaxID=672921 RepID=UPI003DA48304
MDFESIFGEMNLTRDKKMMCRSRHAVSVFIYYVNVALIGPVAITGVILNVINIIALNRQRMAAAAVFMLEFLALLDIGVLITGFIYFVLRYMYGNRGVSKHGFYYSGWGFNLSLALKIDPLYNALLQTRNWCLVLISVDRLIVILAPLKAKIWSTRKNAIKSIAVLVVFDVVLRVLNSLYVQKFHLTLGTNLCTGETHLKARKISPLNPATIYAIENASYIVCFVTLPLILLIIINAVLITSLAKSQKSRESMTQNDQRVTSGHKQATKMIVGIITVFIICESAPSIDRLAKLFLKHGYPRAIEIKLNYLRRISLFLVIADSSLNFFVYFFSNFKFRLVVLQLFNGDTR